MATLIGSVDHTVSIDLRGIHPFIHHPTSPPPLPPSPSLSPPVLPAPMSQSQKMAHHWAAEKGNLECLEVLIKAGCDVMAKDEVCDEWGGYVRVRVRMRVEDEGRG